MELKEEFIARVMAHLDSLSAQFEQELTAVLSRGFASEVAYLQIEYDAASFSDSFPIYLYAMDSEANLVGQVHWFLRGSAVVVPAEIYDAEKYEDVEPWETASEIVERWLIRVWSTLNYRGLPTYLAHHDSFLVRNITDGTETNLEKILEAARA